MALTLSRPAPMRSYSAAHCRPRNRVVVVAAAKQETATYTAPSAATAANELQALAALTNIVPDTLMLESSVTPKAATVSSLLLSWILSNEQLGMRPYQNAIAASLNYDACRSLSGEERLSCQLDKALVNVGGMLAGTVEGRVCTEIDPRLAKDKDAMVAKAKRLLSLYDEMGVTASKLIFRVPATWAGLQAAASLEADGIATQAFHIYSFVQGVAAAQAGVSVVQANVGRTRDWYNKNPGVIRDPHGPREDSGFSSGVDPGVRLAAQVYTYAKKFHPNTQVMASGLRTKDDALSLAGCDYLVLTSKVMKELEDSSTLQGYNTGLSAASASVEDGIDRVLSPAAAAADPMAEVAPVTEASFQEQLGPAGSELLSAGLAGLVRDVQTLLPYFEGMAKGSE